MAQFIITLTNNSQTDLINPITTGNVNPTPPMVIEKGQSFTCTINLGDNNPYTGSLLYTENQDGTDVGIKIDLKITPILAIHNVGNISGKLNAIHIDYQPI